MIMAEKGSQKGINSSTILLVVISAFFTTTAVVQFIWTQELQKKYEQSQRELVQLKTDCFKFSLREASDSVLVLNNKEPEPLEDDSGGHKRDLQQMLTDMMLAQEKILLDHCMNDTVKLCVPGPKGDRGFKGDPGNPGSPGLPGVLGSQGAKGDTGPKGQKGEKGSTGPKGETGLRGADGQKGVPGPKGAPGLKGQKGEPGPVGPKGKPGLNGLKGDPGLQGTKGSQGAPGPRGAKGDQGVPGPKGEKGAEGPRGPQGLSGVQLQNDCLCIKPPTIDVFEPKNDTMYYRLGSNVRLMCGSNSTTVPTPTVSWTTPDPNQCITRTGSNLNINSLQPSQVGNYTCTVTNPYGSVSKTFVIKSQGPSAISCDFDMNNMCLWKTNQSSTGTWKVHNGQTPTGSTGPNADHTTGNNNGYYAYIESSFDQPGAEAFLISPELPPTGQACFTFWYNMHGSQIGSLALETVERLKDCSETTQVRLSLAGDQGNLWHQGQINIPVLNNPHRIVLKSTRGSGNLGDTAVDDLKYEAGKCKSNMQLNGPSEEFITISANSPLNLNCNITGTPTPTFTWSKQHSCGGSYQSYKGSVLHEADHATTGDSGTYICTANNGPLNNVTKIFHVKVNDTGSTDKCTFDNGAFCDWKQVTSDDFDWTIHSGSTPSLDTGPDGDRTQSSSGNQMYIYTEASSPRKSGDHADLISHMLPANQTKCLSLWYYMYGSNTGDLKVFLEDECTHQRTEVFSETGDKGQKWLNGVVKIPASSVPNDYKIVIRGTVGSSYHGDTALDDIQIEDSTCSASALDCDFSHGICQWTQAKNDDFDWTRLTGSTASSNTGPSGDHTNPSGGGYYMYTEGSSPRTKGDVAIIQSPTLPAGQDYCFSLATNMYGDAMGSIAVMVKDATASSGSGSTTLANYSTASSTEVWREHSIYIPAQRNSFQILIKGTTGSGFASDAAIDDLSIHSGKC